MKETIFFLTEDAEKLAFVIQTLKLESINIEFVDKAQLINDIYKKKPAALIIDLDCFNNNSLEVVNSVLAVSYLPTLCIASTDEHAQKQKYFKDSTLLMTEHIATSLAVLIEQAIKFSKQYVYLNQTYDTINLMDEELKDTIELFINTENEGVFWIIGDYLKTIFLDNIFLNNKPTAFWLIYDYETKPYATLFKCHNEKVCYEITINISNKDVVIFNESIKTGFFKNLNKIEYSDVDQLEDFLPAEIISLYAPQNNLVCFGTNNLVLLALDYNHSVTQYDINTIKSLTIKFDMMLSIKRSMNEVHDAFTYTMNALARAAEAKDDVTGHHIKRVNMFSRVIAEEMNLPIKIIREIEIAAQMHDVGKIYVDEAILSKPSKLTDEEFDEIKRHTIYGQKIIGDSKYLVSAAIIARSHHEKYDGSGYPDGIKGDEIPLEARIVTLADIYDALRSKRPYKQGYTHEEAYRIIVEGDGRVEPCHFDPLVLEAFKRVHGRFEGIYRYFTDEGN